MYNRDGTEGFHEHKENVDQIVNNQVDRKKIDKNM